jgi:hypothetical protein
VARRVRPASRTRKAAYTQYAGQGLYTNLCGAGCREKIAEYWTPRLDGRRSPEECLSALVASFK